ncbi:WRKY domain-containing protein [Psidium guajava]|nr:WRKY domain-containing protein [Psidium guajava]
MSPINVAFGVPKECISSWEDHVDPDYPEIKFKKFVSVLAVKVGLACASVMFHFVAMYSRRGW